MNRMSFANNVPWKNNSGLNIFALNNKKIEHTGALLFWLFCPPEASNAPSWLLFPFLVCFSWPFPKADHVTDGSLVTTVAPPFRGVPASFPSILVSFESSASGRSVEDDSYNI